MGECSGREDRRFEKHAKNVEAGAADGPDGTRMLRHRSRLECCVIDLGVERPMHGFRNQLLVAVMALASSSLVMLAGQQTPAAGRYSGAQAAAGRTVYQMQCSSCHQPDLKGQGEAPPLAGSEFIEAWGRRSPRELLAFMQLTMPPAGPGGLADEEPVSIDAFILQTN